MTLPLFLLASVQAGSVPALASRMDHVGVGVRSLAAATQSFRKLGFVVVPGGKHPGGTENSAIFFPDGSYLELLGVYDSVKAADMAATIRKREGALFAGLSVASAANTAAALKDRGLDVVGPTGGTIRLPTDTTPPGDRWWIVQFKDTAWPWSALFFLEYEPKFLAAASAGFQAQGAWAHPNSAARLHAAWFAARYATATSSALGIAGLNLDPERHVAHLGATARVAKLDAGAVAVLGPAPGLVQVDGGAVVGVTVAVASVDSVLKVLKRKGDPAFAPYAGLFGRSVIIPPSETHGVWLEFAEVP